MRLLFMGSPEFALPTLKALDQQFNVIGVFTQPDRKAGRGRRLQSPPVKELSEILGIPVYQPSSLKNPETHDLIQGLTPDAIIVTAYGKILPNEILTIPTIACVNIHASLLPRWRGAAPIQAAILAGDEITGVTIMRMDPGLDTGPIYQQASTKILPDETSGELSKRLAVLGAETLMKALPAIFKNELKEHAQDDSIATYAPMLKKTDGLLIFSHPAISLARQVRAYEPWPSSFFIWKGSRIVVREAEAVVDGDHPSGKCLEYNRLPAIASNPGILVLHKIQPAGKRAMPGDIFLNGAKDFTDGRITDPPDATI
jgi:methionyl-tRNA formyltransferase